MVTYTIAITLIYIVTSFFEYLSRMVLKRIPTYDHDFLATGLQVVIFALAFYLCTLQTFGFFSVAELEDQPLLIPSSLGLVVSVECVIFGIHKLFICCKTLKINRQIGQPPPATKGHQRSAKKLRPAKKFKPLKTLRTAKKLKAAKRLRTGSTLNPVVLQVQDLPLPRSKFNTNSFNPSVHTDHTNSLFVAIGFSWFVFLIAFAKVEDITGFHGYIYNLWSCFVLPLIFCTVSPKLRRFIRKSFVKQSEIFLIKSAPANKVRPVEKPQKIKMLKPAKEMRTAKKLKAVKMLRTANKLRPAKRLKPSRKLRPIRKVKSVK